MASQSAEERNEEIVQAVHGYSREALEIAKSFLAGDSGQNLQSKARELLTGLPGMTARAREADEAYRPDLNLALSEANLDLEYVLAGGRRPSSMRLGRLMSDE
jgi:hypothetical protein